MESLSDGEIGRLIVWACLAMLTIIFRWQLLDLLGPAGMILPLCGIGLSGIVMARDIAVAHREE